MRAFLYGAPIGVLGGLIGLGGAEFRLQVLTEVFRYSARLIAHPVGGQSVPSQDRKHSRSGKRRESALNTTC